MRANRDRDTSIEIALRCALHGRGMRFRKNLRIDLPAGRVRPDIVFTKLKLAVFVDGCFWHGCTAHRTIPRSNHDFWRRKIEGTRFRDEAQTKLLRSSGWAVIRVWEHEPVDVAADRIEQFVHARKSA
ncbi:MAG: very short patch repair endonuclease [Actinobacteria bacterium]|nr:very short patch repair endonuclease [Actinomycetota bacterium]